MLVLARANYEIRFDPTLNVSERIIFPSSPTETNGIEDARFVQFTHDDGRVALLRHVHRLRWPGDAAADCSRPKTSSTSRSSTLNGPEVKNKGFALFPRMVNGQYAMLSRQDNENIFLMYSDMPHFWYTQGADRQADVSRGSSCSWATAARRSRRRPAGWC